LACRECAGGPPDAAPAPLEAMELWLQEVVRRAVNESERRTRPTGPERPAAVVPPLPMRGHVPALPSSAGAGACSDAGCEACATTATVWGAACEGAGAGSLWFAPAAAPSPQLLTAGAFQVDGIQTTGSTNVEDEMDLRDVDGGMGSLIWLFPLLLLLPLLTLAVTGCCSEGGGGRNFGIEGAMDA